MKYVKKIKRIFKKIIKKRTQEATAENYNNEYNKIKVFAGSVIGGRKNNQDYMMIDSEIMNVGSKYFEFLAEKTRYFMVCDGMGGEEYGELASKTAAEEFRNRLQNLQCEASQEDIKTIIENVNEIIVNELNMLQARGGTTFSLVEIKKDKKITIYNVGDSPVFITRDGDMELLSEEQSVAGIQFSKGELSEEEYSDSNGKNILLAFLGDHSARSLRRLHINQVSCNDGDRILICSDGVTDIYNRKRILEFMISKKIYMDKFLSEAGKIENSDNKSAVMICL